MLNRCGIRATNVMLPFDDALVREQLAGVDRKHPLLSYHDPKNLKSMFEEKDFADRPVDIFRRPSDAAARRGVSPIGAKSHPIVTPPRRLLIALI